MAMRRMENKFYSKKIYALNHPFGFLLLKWPKV